MKKNQLCACIAPLLVLEMRFENMKQVNEKQTHSKVVYEDALLHDMSIGTTSDLEGRDILVSVRLEYEDFLFRDIRPNENVDSYKKEKLETAKEYYTFKNKTIIDRDSSFKCDEMYVSTYGPFITYNFEKIEDSTHLISKIEEKKYVDEISISYSTVEKENLERAKGYVNASEYINHSTYTGNGVTVGILESGIVDKKHENLVNTNLTVRDEWYYIETVTEHSTIMASIIAGKNGVAPKAKILSVELSGNPESEIDWLLDNGVDVINLSYGDKNPDGKYSSKSAYMDYIANQYGIMFVASTGNDGGNVCNPGLGYNVLSVGSCIPSEFHYVSRRDTV